MLIIENWTTLRSKTNIRYSASANFKTNYKKQNISSKSICMKHTIWFVWKKKWKTIFKIRYKHYKYTIMSFELTNVLITYQKLINNAFKKHLNIFVIAYFDDIFIYFKNMNEHVRHVDTMFQCLNEWNLLIKLKKCNFH